MSRQSAHGTPKERTERHFQPHIKRGTRVTYINSLSHSLVPWMYKCWNCCFSFSRYGCWKESMFKLRKIGALWQESLSIKSPLRGEISNRWNVNGKGKKHRKRKTFQFLDFVSNNLKAKGISDHKLFHDKTLFASPVYGRSWDILRAMEKGRFYSWPQCNNWNALVLSSWFIWDINLSKPD